MGQTGCIADKGNSMKARLKKRLRYLWTFELANALVFFPLYYYIISLNTHLGWFSLLSLIVVCAILAVGAAFWFLKSCALNGSDVLYQPATRRFFRASKIGFRFALLALLVLFVVRAGVQEDAAGAELLLGGALWGLGLLEFINYYVVQLMYDNKADLHYLLVHRRLKQATMLRELDI
jgi:hypothetical protein